VVDASGLEFIDGRALVALNRHAAATGATLVLRSPPSIVPRLLTVVDLPAVQLEVA
jgi:STAS domain